MKYALLTLAFLLIIGALVVQPASATVYQVWTRSEYPGCVTAMAMDPTATYAIYGNNSGWLEASGVATGSIRWNLSATGNNGAITQIQLDSAGDKMVYTTPYNVTYTSTSNPTSSPYTISTAAYGMVQDAAITPDGLHWAYVTNNELFIRDNLNNLVLWANATSGTAPQGVTFTNIEAGSTSTYFVTGGGAYMQVWDIATQGGWYQGYKYMQPQTITGSSVGKLDNLPAVFIRVFNTTGVSSGTDVYVGYNVTLPSMHDVKFYDTTSGALVPIAKVQYESVNDVNFTLAFPTLGVNEVHNLQVYYGNSSATADISLTSTNSWVIGPLSMNPTTVFNWNMEQNGLWAFSYLTSGGYALPDKSWSTQGAASLNVNSSCYTNENSCSASATETSSVGIPGWNGTSTYTGWGSSVSMDGVFSGNVLGTGGSDSGSSSGNYYIGGNLVWAPGCSANSGNSCNTGSTYRTGMNATVSAGTTISMTALGSDSASTGTTGHFTAYANLDNINLYRYIDPGYMPTYGTWGTAISQYAGLAGSTTLPEPIVAFDASPSNAVDVQTTTYINRTATSTSGFGTFTYDLEGAATPEGISGATAYVSSIRGNYLYIYDQNDNLLLSQAAGNSFNNIFMSSSGTWDIGTATDGQFYVMSKSGSSAWGLLGVSQSNSQIPVNVTIPATTGQMYFMIGRINGGVELWTSGTVPTSPANTSYKQDIYIIYNGAKYQYQAVEAYSSTTEGNWVDMGPYTTDSNGHITVQITSGLYYQITIQAGAYQYIWMSGDQYAAAPLTWTVTTARPTTPYYEIAPSVVNGNIVGSFTDNVAPISLGNVQITDQYTHNPVYIHRWQNVYSFSYSYNLTSANAGHNFLVQVNVNRVAGPVNVPYTVAGNSSAAGVPQLFPGDPVTSNAVCMIIVLIIIIIFAYPWGPLGPVAGIMIAAYFTYNGWMSMDWGTLSVLGCFFTLAAIIVGGRSE